MDSLGANLDNCRRPPYLHLDQNVNRSIQTTQDRIHSESNLPLTLPLPHRVCGIVGEPWSVGRVPFPFVPAPGRGIWVEGLGCILQQHHAVSIRKQRLRVPPLFHTLPVGIISFDALNLYFSVSLLDRYFLGLLFLCHLSAP